MVHRGGPANLSCHHYARHYARHGHHYARHGTAIYNDTTMHGTASLNSQHIMTPQTPNGCCFIFFALIGKKSVFFTFFKQSLTLLLLQFWMLTNLFCCSHPVRVVAAESMGKFCGEVVNLSDKNPCTERERSRWVYNSSNPLFCLKKCRKPSLGFSKSFLTSFLLI